MPRRGGWRRVRSGSGFRYVDANGEAIDDEDQVERIRGLAIPPAWRDVWISPNPRAKVQAVGLDRAGRRQYRYSDTFREAQEQAKYARLIRFGERLPGLRQRMSEHMELEPAAHERVCAVAVRLIDMAWFRVGSERTARARRVYGVTTLSKRHVSVRGTRVTFRFPTKNRAQVRTTVVDDELADAVRELLAQPGGGRVFRYRRNGDLVALTAPQLNEYLREHLGPEFTAKDFRTWGGTLAAAAALAEHDPPRSEAELKRLLAAVARRVGERLGNTPAVARSSYIAPAVVEAFEDGRTLDDFRSRALRIVRARGLELDPEEAALLSLLRSARARSARATA
jgi:DNA topoisomerase I